MPSLIVQGKERPRGRKSRDMNGEIMTGTVEIIKGQKDIILAHHLLAV